MIVILRTEEVHTLFRQPNLLIIFSIKIRIFKGKGNSLSQKNKSGKSLLIQTLKPNH